MTSPDRSPTGATVRQARKARVLTQEQLALASGTSVSSVARLERGEPVSPETLKSVCAVLGLDAVALYVAPPKAPDPAPSAYRISAEPPVRAGPGGIVRRVAALAAGATLFAFLLALGIESGIGAYQVTRAGPVTDRLNETLYAVAAHARAAESNRAAAAYSALLPADDPDRSWQPWDQPRPVEWLNCDAKATGFGAALLTGSAWAVLGIPECRDMGINEITIRRDADATETLLGPMPAAAALAILGLLTPDPSVAVTALVSDRADAPGPDPGWFDPRRRAPPAMDGKPSFLRIRLARAAS